MQTKIKLCLISSLVGIFIGGALGFFGFKHFYKQPISPTVELESLSKQLDSLQLIINSYKPKIDTFYIYKEKIKYNYEEKATTIWNQSSSDDWKFFTEFLSSRFPGDSSTIEAN